MSAQRVEDVGARAHGALEACARVQDVRAVEPARDAHAEHVRQGARATFSWVIPGASTTNVASAMRSLRAHVRREDAHARESRSGARRGSARAVASCSRMTSIPSARIQRMAAPKPMVASMAGVPASKRNGTSRGTKAARPARPRCPR